MAITSEFQKIYGNTERNTGAKTYTLFRGEASDAKPTFAQPGDVFEEYDTGKVYVASRDGKNRTVWTEDQNAKRQTESGQTGLPAVTGDDNGKVMKVAGGAWGLGTDSGLPEGFPAEGIANANKFLGFDASGDYAALTAPSGGAEKFVVTLTNDNDTWTADKTIAEIVEAKEAGVTLVAAYTDTFPYEIPFVGAYVDPEETGSVCVFSAVCINTGSQDASSVNVMIIAQQDRGTDYWSVAAQIVPQNLPSYSSSNNGQVLGVDDGDLAWVAATATSGGGDDYAPLVVTLNAQGVGDKTYGEAMTAAQAGRIVMFKSEIIGVFLAQSITYSSDNILIETNVTGFTSVSGGTNDTIQHS